MAFGTPDIDIVELVNGDGNMRQYTCASNVTISKNILLYLSDPRTVSAALATFGVGKICAGVSSMDKDGTDSSTTISAYTNCIIDVVASGAITAGDAVVLAGDNSVMAAGLYNVGTASGALLLTGIILGYALETAANAEKIEVRLML